MSEAGGGGLKGIGREEQNHLYLNHPPASGSELGDCTLVPIHGLFFFTAGGGMLDLGAMAKDCYRY